MEGTTSPRAPVIVRAVRESHLQKGLGAPACPAGREAGRRARVLHKKSLSHCHEYCTEFIRNLWDATLALLRRLFSVWGTELLH